MTFMAIQVLKGPRSGWETERVAYGVEAGIDGIGVSWETGGDKAGTRWHVWIYKTDFDEIAHAMMKANPEAATQAFKAARQDAAHPSA